MTARLKLEEIIIRCNLIHNYKYSYHKVFYKNAHCNVKIICPIHGSFLSTINNHLYNKRGCPLCGTDKLSEISRSNTSDFIQKAIIVHGIKYDYSKVEYLSAIDKIEIICYAHGSFFQIPSGHLSGKGCRKCFSAELSLNKTLTTDEFIKRANVVHDYFYNYEITNYTGSSEKLNIICPKHGIFTQNANSHLIGSGCRKCGLGNSSQKEQLWLDTLNISKENRLQNLFINNKRYCVDGYDPDIRTVYEFYGDYWHGNPKVFSATQINRNCKKSFGELFDLTIFRENVIRNAGYKVVSIWENDFDLLMKERDNK